jgi:hypothetical protein
MCSYSSFGILCSTRRAPNLLLPKVPFQEKYKISIHIPFLAQQFRREIPIRNTDNRIEIYVNFDKKISL